MNQRCGPHAPAHYEVRIEGHLDEYWSTWFGGLTLIREDDGTTTLRGAVTDQAELHGLLSKVHNLGITLISVMSVRSVDDHDPPEQQRQ
jgi:GTPase